MNLVLHHYDFSNFAEKVRLMMGFKELSWESVETTSTLPKPDYLPLTGGYRRVPALQIGADVYCDTRLIAARLEELRPEPSFYPGGSRDRALSRALADWAESTLLWPAALYITGINADRFPESFHLDRAVLHNKPPPDIAKVKASAMKYLGALQNELQHLEDFFSGGAPYVLGEQISLADLSLYHPPWLVNTIDPDHGLFQTMPRMQQWMERIAALGHGRQTPLQAAAAIERANAAVPAELSSADVAVHEGIALGEPVSVSPTSEHSPASGQFVFADKERITIAVSNERVNRVHVHFPRSGYRLSRLRKP